jgi:hypothetical protein
MVDITVCNIRSYCFCHGDHIPSKSPAGIPGFYIFTDGETEGGDAEVTAGV